ncbi:MAG: restriction endonuclease, partial [Prevotellaceae bacterium]|nr:restriction endonuclease [Prevotellaceae bacterium]
ILHSIERDQNLTGNREQDYSIDISTSAAIDYVWSSLRNDWRFYKERSGVNDPYGTRRARDLMERLFQSLDYGLVKQTVRVEVGGKGFEISHLCPDLSNMPFIVVGENVVDDSGIDTLDKCSLDYRAKGSRRKKSPHATMLEYLNATENVYGFISNGATIRLLRNSGQLVKLTYIEFDLRRMLEEDKYTEFCLMFRLLHASRFRANGDEPCVMERWFNMSIESGNRIRSGLSLAVQKTMETIGNAAFRGNGEGNEALRKAFSENQLDAATFNKELIHFIYRLLFLFIIEDRNLVYQIPEDADSDEYRRICRWQDIYKQNYAASRLRRLSELSYLRQRQYHDLWEGLMDTFRLFEDGSFGSRMGISPLGGILFDKDTLHYLKLCRISNRTLLEAFAALNEFTDERGMTVKINYSSLDVEEFGSVYEGILEMRPFVQAAVDASQWQFGYVGGLDRQSTSSYYTRPDLVRNLIRTTLEPVIKERIARLSTPEEKVKSLLSMKVCDAASGSGHIILAMARTIAWYVCSIRTGEDNPASQDYRQALREVIQRCVYAVDYNPDAVELCKVVLWIEGYCAGKPLSFLDHHIRCGNSVVGISDLETLLNGVPKDAFSAKDNDREVKKQIIKLNKEALDDVKVVQSGLQQGLCVSLFTQDFTIQSIDSEQVGLAEHVREISAMPENSLIEQVTKQKYWEELMQSPRVEWLRRACDIYTYAFYKQFASEDLQSTVDDTGTFTAFAVPYTRTVYQALQEIKYLDDDDNTPSAQRISPKLCAEAAEAARTHRFFHWAVEFPDVFAYDGGFDVMCGNPPWDKLQMEEEKWFAGKDEDIVNAANQDVRKNMIAALTDSNRILYNEFIATRNSIIGQSSFIRNSYRFPLTAVGKLELSSLFAELCLTFSKEAWGLVLPTGIATNDGNKAFFSKLIYENRLVSLYDFENRKKLFDIDSRIKFCLLTAGKPQTEPRTVSGGFYLTRIDHLLDPRRIYTLQTSDFARLNPNTKLCPIFRTSKDAVLTAKIYRHAPILFNEATSEDPWGIRFMMMFNMASASSLFQTRRQLDEMGGTQTGSSYFVNDEEFVPLYEGKMIWFYNHHYGSFPNEYDVTTRPKSIDGTNISILQETSSPISPWYWVKKSLVDNRLIDMDKKGNIKWQWNDSYYIAFRDVARAADARTCVASLMPSGMAAGHKAPLVFTSRGLIPSACFAALLSSLVFDYVAKQKVGGSSMGLFIMKQMPVLTPEQIPSPMQWQIIKRVAELCYFNHDLDGWATELWEEMNEEQRAELPQLGNKQPWIFNPDRRALLQAELDAIFAHLYGLTTEDLRYILDPEDVCGEGCINETFRVLKDNELRQYGEYRTKRLVLDAWNRFGYDN